MICVIVCLPTAELLFRDAFVYFVAIRYLFVSIACVLFMRVLFVLLYVSYLLFHSCYYLIDCSLPTAELLLFLYV